MPATQKLVKRLFLSAGSIYLFAILLAQLASVIRILALPYMLSPIELGLWSLFNMLIGYGANSHLGLLHGMNKLYPAMRTRGEVIEATALRDSVFTVCNILGIVVALLIAAVGLFRFPGQMPSVFFTSLAVFFQCIHTFYFSLMRAENRFRSVGLILAITSIANTGLVLGFMAFNGRSISNAMAGLMMGQAISSLLVYTLSQTKLTLVIKQKELKMAFAAGFPLLVVGFIDMFFATIDRWILSSYADPKEFGFYSLAAMVCGVLILFSAGISSFTYTRMIEINASETNDGHGFKLFEHSHDLLSLLLLLLITLVWQLVPFLVEHFATRYLEAVPLLKVLTIGYYYLALAGTCGSYAISCNKQNHLLVRQIIAFALITCLCYAAMKFGFGLVGYGITVSSVLFVFYFLYLNVAASSRPSTHLLVLKKILTISAPIGIALVIQYFAKAYIIQRPTMLGAIMNTCLEIAMCWAGVLLTFFILNRSMAVGLYTRLFKP